MSPFMIFLNIVCAIILVLYIVHTIRVRSRIKKAQAAKKDLEPSEKVILNDKSQN